MSGLSQSLDDYLVLRRSLGYKLELAQRLLSDFIEHVERQGSAFVTTKLSLEWATLPTNASPKWKADRLSVVRGFAKYMHAFDARTEIPPLELLPRPKKRPTPYLYSDKDVSKLMESASGIRTPLKAFTYSTLIGLLAVTGMRIGEAIALDRDDIHWRDKLLEVQQSKFGKSREVLLHRTTLEALRTYARRRDKAFPSLRTPSFFVSLAGTRLYYRGVHLTFFALVHRAGLSEARPARPRIHGLRHSFAVKTLLEWYEAGLNVESRLPLLSTYLGHVSPTNTYWYLTATPELLRLAAERREHVRARLP